MSERGGKRQGEGRQALYWFILPGKVLEKVPIFTISSLLNGTGNDEVNSALIIKGNIRIPV